MRRTSLSTLLVGVNAALVLLAVAGVAWTAARLLGRLADEQALARVALAGAGAREAVERSAADVRTSATLLAERPTVLRLLRAGDAASLAPFLERFRGTSRLAGCALFLEGRPFATSGGDLPWARLLSAAGTHGRPVFLPRPGWPPLLAGAAPVEALPGATAVAVLALDDDFVRATSAQVGLPVAIVPAGGVAEASAKLGDRYVAALPLQLGPGAPVAVIQAELPASAIASSLTRWRRALVLLSLLVAALAILSGLAIGRRIGRPVAALTTAADRIGRGDLATPIPRAAGAEVGTLAATMEEMRRRLLELTAELRRRQAEAEAVLSGIAEGVFAVDRGRRILYLNPQTAALLGIDPGAALGRFCGDVLRPQPGRDGTLPCAERCPIVHARFRGTVRATEHLLLPDGGRRALVVTSSPPAEGRQFQVLRDETETEAARRLRDAVLANVSHELKTPLAAQLASIELLADRLAALEDGEAGQLVASLERGTLRLTRLVDNLLESVRIEAGQDSIRRRPVALDEVVEQAVELTRPLLGQRGQRLSVELPYPLPPVAGDAPRLTQVFVNLLANANKFAPPASTIRIGGEVGERRVALWVEDEGPGFPAGASGALFAPFVRSVDQGPEEPEESGMGLGLAIVKSIIERHGGEVEALPAGKGTRVRVILPLEEAA